MRLMRRLHKWLGLLVAAQFLLWGLSGAVFAWLDADEVSADSALRAVEPPTLPPSLDLREPSDLLREYGSQSVEEIRLTALDGQWLWRVELPGRVELRSAQDGAAFQLDGTRMRRIAASRYAGEGRLLSITLLPAADLQSRAQGPVWRADFDDTRRTTLYFAADDGRLLAARNSSWRLFDLFWMLHTMDYATRDNFNNPLVITLGLAASWLSLTGLVLLTRSFRDEPLRETLRRPDAGYGP
jgi:Na+-transporting NADH:ubiquinone oxidoreductase subunit F